MDEQVTAWTLAIVIEVSAIEGCRGDPGYFSLGDEEGGPNDTFFKVYKGVQVTFLNKISYGFL